MARSHENHSEYYFVKVPKKLLMDMARSSKLSEATRVLSIVLIQTHGWHKSHDRLAQTKIAEMTGMEPPNVHRALEKLQKAGFVGVRGRKHRMKVIGFDNPDYQYKEYGLSKKIDTIDTRTKETITKEVGISRRTESLFESIDKMCQERGMKNRMTLASFDPVAEKYGERLKLKAEARRCIEFLLEKGNKILKTTTIDRWCERSVKYQKQEEEKLYEQKKDNVRSQQKRTKSKSSARMEELDQKKKELLDKMSMPPVNYDELKAAES